MIADQGCTVGLIHSNKARFGVNGVGAERALECLRDADLDAVLLCAFVAPMSLKLHFRNLELYF